MANCLGIYLNDNIVKYAKVSSDNNANIKLEQYGVRFASTNKKALISEIIEHTNSKDCAIVLNSQDDKYITAQMYDQAQTKNYAADVMKMEFEAWCEKNAKSPDKYSYVYRVSDLKNSENKKDAVINIAEKSTIEEYSTINGVKISNIYPSPLLLENLVSLDETNYILVNLDDDLTITVVIDGKLAEFRSYNVGMKSILADFTVRLGSYQKAYEACKQMNVFTEGESINDKALEGITEPILQEVLKYVSMQVTKHRKDVSKVILTGTGVVFTNIDILFREYLEIKCEILKPKFVTDTSNVRNIAEILETTAAITLAYEGLTHENRNLEFLTSTSKIKKTLSSLFESRQKSGNTEQRGDEKESRLKNKSITTDFTSEKVVNLFGSSAIVISLILITYLGFTGLYTSKVESMKKDLNREKEDTELKTKEIENDFNYINSNTKKYKEINDEVSKIASQIENNQIKKYTTYNVASFLQNIIKVIPKNIQLKTISSDDNKHIKIVAQSASYADLGYFVAQLKIDGVLNNVKINNVKNATTTIVEIGGELP
ncbi:MAG: PilN domain-containing protein [Clostridia bacterium]